MKSIILLLAVSSFLFSKNTNAQNTDIENHMDNIIVETKILKCSKEEAFEMFTVNKNLENWLTAKANVEHKKGGMYELFWEPDDVENNSTIGCRILAIDKPNYLNFEWKGPKQYKQFMNFTRPLTNVTVIFNHHEVGTQVTLIHTGWKVGKEWNQARQYFVKAWSGAFDQLESTLKSN